MNSRDRTAETDGSLLDEASFPDVSDLISVELTGTEAEAPPEQVAHIFEGAGRFRPLLLSTSVALGLLVVYALVAVAPLVSNQPITSGEMLTTLVSTTRIVASQGGDLGHSEACTRVEGVVFVDDVADGVLRDNESGVGGIDVEVRGPRGDVVATTTSATDGTYAVDLPAAMAVVVEIDLEHALELGLWPGPRVLAQSGTQQLVDRQPCLAAHGMRWLPRNAQLPTTTVSPETQPVVPLAPSGAVPVQLHGRLWLDANANGRFEPTEQVLSAIAVELRDDGGSVVAVATTGTGGLYSFSNLRENRQYSVHVADTAHDLIGVSGLGVTMTPDVEPVAVVRTGSGGLAVWGIDFSYAAGQGL